MPTRDEYIAKAEHNEAMARSIIGSQAHGYYDWVVIALFYSALYYVNAYITQFLPQPQNHIQRRDCIKRLRGGWDNEYRNLKDESEAARYEVIYNINQQRLDDEIISDFESLKNTIRNDLGI